MDLSFYTAVEHHLGLDHTGTATLSGSLTEFGTIRAVNAELCRLLGYNGTYLIGKSFNELLPAVLGGQGGSFLAKIIRDADQTIVDKALLVFGRHASGHLVPLLLEIKSCVPSEHELTFAGT